MGTWPEQAGRRAGNLAGVTTAAAGVGTTTAGAARRRVVRLLGILAAALLLAGLLPWVTWGELTVRLFALPMLLAGLMVAGAAVRVRAVGRRVPSAPPVERGCEGCVCGLESGCDTKAALDRTATG